MTTPRITARFHPQVWEDFHDPKTGKIDAEPQGPIEWDVTDDLMFWGKKRLLALRDDTFASDNLKFLPDAPEWIKRWTGPFWVEVEQSVAAYFAAAEV